MGCDFGMECEGAKGWLVTHTQDASEGGKPLQVAGEWVRLLDLGYYSALKNERNV